MRIVVLDSFTADQGDASVWQALRAHGELTLHARTAASQVAERCAGHDAVLTNKVALDGATIDALTQLRYVGVMATGVNVVDVQACGVRKIAVTNVPGYSTMSVAQLVFAHVLHATHDVAGHDARVKAGEWARSPDFCFFTRPLVELAGKTLVVIGLGAIGRAVSRIGEALGMRVIAAEAPGSTSAGRVPLAEALPQADVVTLHCPLTERTRGLVSRAFLAQLRPGAMLINTGRGALVDEAALAEALASGRLGRVALDVLASEPPPAGHPLLRADAPWSGRVAITPHIAWGTVEARRRLVDEVAQNLASFAAGLRRNRVD